jgi:hypothetical protein
MTTPNDIEFSLTGDDLIFAAITPDSHWIKSFSENGYYMAQNGTDNILLLVQDNYVAQLDASVKEIQESGYRFTPMAVMPVSEYKSRLHASKQEGFQEGYAKGVSETAISSKRGKFR